MVDVLPQLVSFIHGVESEFDLIPSERKSELAQLADYCLKTLQSNREVNLIFICTHNSRRSHISQLWAKVAASYNGFSNILTFSGGTEGTAFNPRAVLALKNSGFEIRALDQSENPLYEAIYSKERPAEKCFSKAYDHPANPSDKFGAVMTCSDADEACPTVFGAEYRIAIKYEDPKKFDDTDLESEKYAERVRQIAREMVYAFSLLKQ